MDSFYLWPVSPCGVKTAWLRQGNHIILILLHLLHLKMKKWVFLYATRKSQKGDSLKSPEREMVRRWASWRGEMGLSSLSGVTWVLCLVGWSMLSCGLRPHVRRKEESSQDFSPVCFAAAHLFFFCSWDFCFSGERLTVKSEKWARVERKWTPHPSGLSRWRRCRRSWRSRPGSRGSRWQGSWRRGGSASRKWRFISREAETESQSSPEGEYSRATLDRFHVSPMWFGRSRGQDTHTHFQGRRFDPWWGS